MSDKKPSEWARAEAMNIWVEIGAHEAGSAQDHIAIRLDAARAEGAREAPDQVINTAEQVAEVYKLWREGEIEPEERSEAEGGEKAAREIAAKVAALRATPAVPAPEPHT